MLVHAVAGVDDAGPADARELMRRARRRVAHHDHVRRHRFERPRGVGERLALRHARSRRRHAERVGAQPLLGQLERHARARARLEEQVDDGAAAQRRHFLDRPRADFLHRERGLEDQLDFAGLEVGDAEQMPAAERGGGASSFHLHFVAAVDLRRAAPARSAGATSGCSGRRSRRESAARDGRDRRARRAESRCGRPKSISASSAARIVRPVYSTSSTSRITRSSIENGISVRRMTGCGPTGVPHQVVAVQRDVERAGRHVDAGDRLEMRGQARRQAARRARECRRAPGPRRRGCARESRARCASGCARRGRRPSRQAWQTPDQTGDVRSVTSGSDGYRACRPLRGLAGPR